MHDTPAGVYPSEGPQPSKWPVSIFNKKIQNSYETGNTKTGCFLVSIFVFAFHLYLYSYLYLHVVGVVLLPVCSALHHWGDLSWQVCLDPGDIITITIIVISTIISNIT